MADNGNGVDIEPDGDAPSIVEVNGAFTDVGSQITLASGALLTVNGDGTFDNDLNDAFQSLGTGVSVTDSFTDAVTDDDSARGAGFVDGVLALSTVRCRCRRWMAQTGSASTGSIPMTTAGSRFPLWGM